MAEHNTRIRVSMSNRQYCFLREAIQSDGLTLERMLQISQTTAGSIVRPTRGYMAWNQARLKFVVTRAGNAAMDAFENAHYTRIHTEYPLSKYISTRKLEKQRGT